MTKKIKLWTRAGHDRYGMEYTNINFGRSREFQAYESEGHYLIAVCNGGYAGYWLNEEPTTFDRVLQACKEFFCKHSEWSICDIL